MKYFSLVYFISFLSLGQNTLTLTSIKEAKSLPEGSFAAVTGVITISSKETGSFSYIESNGNGIRIQGHQDWSIGDSVIYQGIMGNVFDEVAFVKDSCCVQNNSSFTLLGNIEPKAYLINASMAQEYIGRLVKLKDTKFKDPQFVSMPNANETLFQEGKELEMRIWQGSSLEGYSKSVQTFDVTGVMGSFRGKPQIYPRFFADIKEGLLEKQEPQKRSTKETLDFLSWNVEWFGNPKMGPKEDQLQMENVAKVLQFYDPDLVVLIEISNDLAFEELLNTLGNYDGLCSNAVSNGDDENGQKVCLIYKKEQFNLLSSFPLLSNTPVIEQYPGGFDGFWAAGRLPALFKLQLKNTNRNLHIVGIHAKANRNSPREREIIYDRRKMDVDILKDTLDRQFANASIILAGDFNDDLDASVVYNKTESTYSSFTRDSLLWEPLSLSLSKKEAKSYIGYPNVIDHILVSNELKKAIVPSSIELLVPFSLVNNYRETTSDHLPLFAQFEMDEAFIAEDFDKINETVIYSKAVSQFNGSSFKDNLNHPILLVDKKNMILKRWNKVPVKTTRSISRKLNRLPNDFYLLKFSNGKTWKRIKIVVQD